MSKLSKYFKSDSGFTLIELLISVAIITIISFVGIASFNNANRRNATTQAAADITSLARKLRTDATSGLKPSGACRAHGVTLEGYYMYIDSGTGNYWYGPGCFNGNAWAGPTPTQKQLPIGLVFNHNFVFAQRYATAIFTFDGEVAVYSSSNPNNIPQNKGYYAASIVAGNALNIAYSDGTERNYIYFSSTGLICYQKTAPPGNCAN